MKSLAACVFFLAVCAILPPPLAAQDASDLFLRAYEDFQMGEKLEREGSLRQALAKYQSAAKVLEQVGKADPAWQPLVVEYRLKKTREGVARLEPQVAGLPVDSSPDGPEGPLPVADGNLPRVDTAPPVTVRQPLPSVPPRTQPRYPDPDESVVGRGGMTADQREVRQLRREMEELRAENQRLTQRQMKSAAELQSALMEVDKTKVTVVELKAQLAQSEAALEDAQNAGGAGAVNQEALKKQAAATADYLASLEADNEVLREENERLFAKLEQAASYISASDAVRVQLDGERESLARARDEALAKAASADEAAAKVVALDAQVADLTAKLAAAEKASARDEVEKLTEQNQSLSTELAAAREESKKLTEANANNPQVAALQSELNGVNDRLLAAQAELAGRDDRVAQLQKQLDETAGELARLKLSPAPTEEERQLIAENELLRGIILRQLQDQAKRDESRKAIEGEIEKLQIKSEVLSQHLAVLGAPVLNLTPEERALFKEPVALLQEPTPGSLEVTMAVVKPDGETSEKPAADPNAIPEEIRPQVEQARRLFEIQNYPEAERIYQEIVEKLPDNYFALSNLGVVQFQQGKFVAAEVALNRAIEILPTDSFAYTKLGIVHFKQGRFDDAIGMLEKAITVNDADEAAHNFLGICFGEKGDFTAAEREIKKAIEINPKYPQAHFNLAILYATAQPPSLDLAKQHYKLATELGAEPDASLERLIQ